MNADTVRRLTSAVASDPDIAARLLSVIWIGSYSHGLDIHPGSDLDIQVVLDEPDVCAMTALARVLADFPEIDLSIVYPKDVWNEAGDLDFQDGTKGAFFIPVLASGKVLHGIDFYAPLRGWLPPQAVRSSLRFTSREYLGRLRVMTLDQGAHGANFNKYVMKLVKDLLVYAGILSVTEMTGISNADLVAFASTILPSRAGVALRRASDYTVWLDISDRAVVLVALEEWFDAIEKRHHEANHIRP